ncbi:MAG TPA: UDP-N-acetylmuramoyl-tripeptide--D-alanyl-D-alanine ligase [Desulfobacteraceae bacterium]|nr:UDP-N-acetylmuramoyl-tripeptide--D-alanyl-D-alanine ligase [Deltaproteobacteria bacterium]MBW2356777.1 UDP-N-acetylmuramoyl-tripeptide--D-alanyl-D-alanine ligase [Deltaproteobacteria bacterium]HDI60810.1 UDP-N-acetylmuramoyl-tripeptide--D-alanyl-D-alanine ligase [Desulfobacteraceae bacterium]
MNWTPDLFPRTIPLAWSGRDLVAATGGEVLCGDIDRHFSGIGIDSRTLKASEVFVAIRGETHDGHRFAQDVVAAGARGLILERSSVSTEALDQWRDLGVLCVAVDDTLNALGNLGLFHRRRCPAQVVAITGSNGKTTTRAMTTAVLEQRFAVAATRGNFNNAIGLPLSLFGLAPVHRWGVFEIGTNHPGEIDGLARICRPDLGVITNIGPAHLEGLGSLEGVREAKAELIGRLAPGGRMILNFDDPQLRLLVDRCPVPPLGFGLCETAEVRAEDVRLKSDALSFRLCLPGGRAAVRMAGGGAFMVINALAAAAVGWEAGLAADQIAAGLAAFTPVAGRMTVIRPGRRGVVLIDDSYNANPASVAAAVDALAARRGSGRTALVLGEMRELGAASADLHYRVGEKAARAGIDRLYVTGAQLAEAVAAGAVAAGMAAGDVRVAAKEEIVADLAAWLAPGDTILVKGSRAAAMETVVAALNRVLKDD